MPIFRVKSVKIYTGQKNLHGYTRGSRDKYEVWAGELGCVVCLVLHTGSEDHAGQRLSQLCSGNITSCLRYLTIRKLLSNPTIRFCVYTVHLSPGVLGKPGILPWLGSARLAKNSVSFSSFSTSCDNKLLNKPKQLQWKIEILEEVWITCSLG